MKGAPALTVDVSASDDLDECPIPMTPANKKALQRTALHKAVIAADMSAAERALSEKPTEVHQRDEHGFTPLHNAAAQPDSRARRQLVEMLLNAGADVHAADNEGFSGLHWAAACGHADVLTLLLNAGARPEQRSASGETALHRASRLGRFNEARLLITAAGAQSVLEPNGGGETVLDVCGKVETRVDTKNRKKLRQLLLESEPRAAVLVLHHSDCLSHMTGDNHQARVKTHRHRQTQTDTHARAHTHTHTHTLPRPPTRHRLEGSLALSLAPTRPLSPCSHRSGPRHPSSHRVRFGWPQVCAREGVCVGLLVCWGHDVND